MSADWALPTVTSNYSTVVLQAIDGRLNDAIVGFDPAVVTPTNIPTNAIRWTSASNKWQKYDGAVWGDLSSLYAINVSGNAGTATIWATGRTVSLTSDVTGTSGSLDGSGNVSITATIATVTAPKGGTGQTTYAIGDVLYASSSSALSKLADVATGNAIISGGVGAAPAWGKIALTTHISGTLPVANGGTGAVTLTGLLSGNGTGAITDGATVNDGNWSGTDLAVVNGGTGSSTAAAARTALSAEKTITVSTSAPSGGSDGDIWFVREA